MVVINQQHKKTLADIPCRALQGVGPGISEKLQKLQIVTAQDLLFHLPLRYEDRTRIYPIAHLKHSTHVCIEGDIVSAKRQVGGKTRLLVQIHDKTGFISLRFFYVAFSQIQTLTVGKRLRCFGEVRFGPAGLEMVHPEYRILANDQTVPLEENLTPIYPTTEGLNQATFRKLTDQALKLLQQEYHLQELLPENLLARLQLPTLKEALWFVHRPSAHANQRALLSGNHPCQQRLAFEELVAHRLSLLRLREQCQVHSAFSLNAVKNLQKKFLDLLPFTLTKAQQRVTAEIEKDLQGMTPMMRLVQGDVGSGKTIVAAYAMLQAVENGCQAALMAPTDILAEQHYTKFIEWFTPLQVPVFFLSGKLPAKARRAALSAIENQQACVVIGTHALFQKEVVFNRLSFIVIDEQHRFGVHQRLSLREKGLVNTCYPHQLIMTATPIPRTLAMTAYADLDNSIIDELPPGRKPVKTIVVSNQRQEDIILRIREECRKNSQVYWVCTLIEESEILQCQAAENRAEQLKKIFPELSTALIHSRIKPQEKTKIMSAFKKGAINILVATTVIEVGVDVPNASIMVIENPERLGLAQLHQLRGRVGRGNKESYCVLMYQSPLSHLAKERLAIMRDSDDGFAIAEKDLELRGPGEMLGTRQTGIVEFRVADIVRDQGLLDGVTEAVSVIQSSSPIVIDLLITRWLGSVEHFATV